MTTLSNRIAALTALVAISAPVFAQDESVKRIANPAVPKEVKVVTPRPTAKEITQTPKAPEKSKAPEKPREYVVRSGDNPWVIARNHGVPLEALMAANEIKDAKNLKIGDVLILPEGTESKNAPKPKTTNTTAGANPAIKPEAGDNWVLYTIKKGDNPWNIAKALKVDHQKIISLNEGTDFTKLNIGQEIKVPKPPKQQD